MGFWEGVVDCHIFSIVFLSFDFYWVDYCGDLWVVFWDLREFWFHDAPCESFSVSVFVSQTGSALLLRSIVIYHNFT